MCAGKVRPQAQTAGEAILGFGDPAEPIVDQPETVMGVGNRRIQPQRLALTLFGFIDRAGRHADQAEVGPRRREILTSLQCGAIIRFRGNQLTGLVQLEALLEARAAHFAGYVV